jgi:hypothetical protein
LVKNGIREHRDLLSRLMKLTAAEDARSLSPDRWAGRV